MSYHGLGKTYPGLITSGSQPTFTESTNQPTGPIQPPAEYAAGEQALVLEMQARSGEAQLYTGQVQPYTGPTQISQLPNIGKYTDSQLFEMMVQHWNAILSGKASPIQPGVLEAMMQAGKGNIIDQAEQYVVSGGRSGGMVPATVAPVAPNAPLPMEPRYTDEQLYKMMVADLEARLRGLPEPIPGLLQEMIQKGKGQIVDQAEQYVMSLINKSGNLEPAQPTAMIAPPSPPSTSYVHTEQLTIPGFNAPIPEGNPPTGTIPPGPDATAAIPQGQLPPKTETYVTDPVLPPPTKDQYLAPPVAASTSSNLIPIIAVGIGAFILAKLLK